MNNNSYQQPEIEINLKEVIWDLLEQWKAIIIVAFLMALFLSGLKFQRDLNTYNTAQQERKRIAQSGKTAEERIDDVISSLPEDEVATVEFMVNQNEWIETEKEYLNKSILMNTNPVNQRTLMLDYYISMADTTESKMTALVYGYAGLLKNEKLVNSLREVIAPESESKYIAELISANGDNSGSGNSSGDGNSLLIDSDADGAIMEVRVVLPGDVDINVVERAITEVLSDHRDNLADKIGKHNIRLVKSTEAYIYNSAAVNNHNSIMTNIYNLQINEKNMLPSLSDRQRTAIESIMIIKKEAREGIDTEKKEGSERDKETVEVLKKPKLSKKYVMLGGILGTTGYGFIYLVLMLLKGRIKNASDAVRYTRTRLIGEIYKEKEWKGTRALLHSNLISKYRYGNKRNPNTQIKNTIDALEVACSHEGLHEVSLISTTEDCDDKIAKEILSKVRERGLDARLIKLPEIINIRELAALSQAVFLIDSETKISKVNELVAACIDYDVTVVGSIYAAEI